MEIVSKINPNTYDTKLLAEGIYKVWLRTNIEESNGHYCYDEYSIVVELDDISKLDDLEIFNKYLEIAKLNEAATVKEEKVKTLKKALDNTDYQVLKSLENYSLGLTLPYDYSILITKRQEIRDSINNIEADDTSDELEQAKQRKINEMCSIAQTTITNGIDFNEKHYRLNTTDQINLTSLVAMAQTGKSVPYHADDEVCRIFEPEEMIELASSATEWIVYHTTYFNLLKHQILETETLEDVKAITYGMQLKDEYQAIINTILGE